jgi:ketosteroid isomerase-like protein
MKYLLSLVLIVVSNFSVANNITEAEVREVMNQLEQAVKARDVDALSKHYSDKVVLNLRMFNGSSNQEMVFDKPKYFQYLKGSWNLIKNYTFRVDSEKIDIESDRAILTYELTESMAMGNQYFKVKSKGTTVFQKENDQLLVVKVDARTI